MNCKNTITFPDGSTFTNDQRTFGERVADHVAKLEAERDKARASAQDFLRKLENWQDANRDMGDRFAAVIAERDVLRAALEDLSIQLERFGTAPSNVPVGSIWDDAGWNAFCNARIVLAALAKVQS